jgi:hypothetical protein
MILSIDIGLISCYNLRVALDAAAQGVLRVGFVYVRYAPCLVWCIVMGFTFEI